VAGCAGRLDQAIALNPQYATAYNNRGNARFRSRDVAGALADYDQAIALNPQYATAYNNRGMPARRKGTVAGALADYDQAIALFPAGRIKSAGCGRRGSCWDRR